MVGQEVFIDPRVSELYQLRQLEEETSQLKRLVADLSLDRYVLREAHRKNLRFVRLLELA